VISVNLLVLVVAGMVAALVAALLSPLGPLFWWAGWTHRPASMIAAPPDAPRLHAEPKHYVVYLSGIGVVNAVVINHHQHVGMCHRQDLLADAVRWTQSCRVSQARATLV
jgi:hypothetical protein